MIDTYLKSRDKAALEELASFVTNMLPVRQGWAESTTTDAEGNSVITEAAGDPAYYYTCVRANFPVPAFENVELCSVDEAMPVTGVWG